MFIKSAEFYDLFYSGKDYAAETQTLQKFIRQHQQSSGKRLLDVACGTGHHIQYLKRLYDCAGIDLDDQLLEAARQRNAQVSFYCADMLTFSLSEKFDVITCLFSAIGYVKTLDNLQAAVGNMARHLKPGGLLLVEPWFDKSTYSPGKAHGIFIDRPGIKACRMNVSQVEGGLSVLTFHYLIATEGGTVEHFTESHELALFSHEEHMQAFRKAGLQVSYDTHGLTGRGLYSGVMPAAD